MTQNLLTGQLMMREMGEAPTKDGRRLFVVFGLIAVPPGEAWKEGHQYTVYSARNDHLAINLTAPIDRDHDTRGMGIGGTLKAPIWRC